MLKLCPIYFSVLRSYIDIYWTNDVQSCCIKPNTVLYSCFHFLRSAWENLYYFYYLNNCRSPKNLVSVYTKSVISQPLRVSSRYINTWTLRRPGYGKLLEKKDFQSFGLLISKFILTGESYSCILNEIYKKVSLVWLSAYNHSYGTHSAYMAIKYYRVLICYSHYHCEFTRNKVIRCSHSWCATSAFLPPEGLVLVCHVLCFRVHEQNYCLQLAPPPVESLFFSSISFSMPHLLCTVAVFTLWETFCLCHRFSITWCWVTVYSRVSYTVLSCISALPDCYTSLFWILLKFFQLWLWCLVACCTPAPLLFQAYDAEGK